MSESCFIIPCVKNTKNEDVPSKLFEDLWHISGNYEWAEQQYKIATDESFLSSVDPIDVVIDKNGQIDARSFMNITGITFTSDEIKQRLSNRWEDNNLPTEEISDKVSEFNDKEELKNDFVPVILPKDAKTVKFTISQRTPNRSAALQTYLENNNIIKVITERLKKLGVAYDFVGKERYNGRFSTENAQKAFDGLYHLIDISKGADIQSTLVEESAHLATLACKDSILINRLLDAINEDTINSLFSPEEVAEADLNTKDGKLELAGKLVAKAMQNQLTGDYKNFLNRVKQSIYKVFSKTDLNSLLSERQRAKLMAEALAHGFLFDDNFDVNVALKTPVTLYSTNEIPEENKLLRGTLNTIKKLSTKINNFSANAYKDTYQKLSGKVLLGDKDLVSLTEQETLAITTSAISSLLDRLNLITEPLTNITKDIFDKDIDIDTINALFEATELVKTLEDISDTFKGFREKDLAVEDSFINEISSLIDSVDSSVSRVNENLNNYVKWYSVALLRESIGRDAIDLAADVVSSGWFSPTRTEKERHISTTELATTYIDKLSDTNSLITFFRTYSNHKDVTTQVFYDIVRKSKAKEAIEYNKELSNLIDIENRWKKFISQKDVRQIIRKYGFDPDTVLYERTDDKKLTGWFVTDIKRGQLEADRKEVLNKIIDDFKGELEAGTLTLSDGSYTFNMTSYKKLSKTQRYNVFQDYKNNHPILESFYDLVYEDKKNKTYKDRYINHNFIDLCERLPEFKDFYNEIVEFKNHIDVDYLTDQTTDDTGGMCHGIHGKIPQFKGSFINKLKNKHKDLSDTSDLAEYCKDVTSDNFGSPITESTVLDKEDKNEVELDKLALYGINSLADMNDLSTNLFKSLDKYLEMACRFHISQSIATRLELFNTQLSKRRAESDLKDVNKDKDAARISSQQRRNIMRRFVYSKNKGIQNFSEETWLGRILNKVTNLRGVAGALSAFGAIRALCISPIAGLKNYFAGLRIFMQDVSTRIVEGVTMKDVVKQTLLNLHPRHVVGEIARVVLGKTTTWDQYQRLIDRWDSYRTPAKIIRRKGFLSLQTLVNLAMANYSVTDNALIGIIYTSMLNSHKVYDADSGKMIKVTEVYKFNKNGNPHIKAGVLKDPKDVQKYRLLKSAREELEAIIENNKLAEEDVNVEISRVSDSRAIQQLEDYYNNNGENLNIFNSSGGYKTAEEIDKVLGDSIREISFNEDDEYKICNGINDYIISSQGVYGMLNATEFQSNVYTQSLGKIKGYMFGYIQRNYYSNFSISNNEYKHAMLDSYRLMLWSVFSNKNLIKGDNITSAQYSACALTLMVLPFAFKNKRLIQHMRNCGWDPDQLKKVSNMCLGFFINFLLAVLSRSLYRGNEKTMGEKIYRGKGNLPLKISATGLDTMYPLLFKLTGNSNQVIKPGILAPKDAIGIDYATVQKQLINWSNPSRSVPYPKNMSEPSEGRFIPGTQEYNDRVASFSLRNTIYDTTDPLYYMTGAFYRLARGVRDEGLTLMDPVRFANDLIEMGDYSSSIMFSSGLKTLWDGASALLVGDEKWDKWKAKEAKFWLSKIGFTYDSKPDPGMNKVQPIDWYGKQETIDRYQEQKQGIPTATR